MDRNNGRYSNFMRRGQGQQNQSHNHYSTSSSSSGSNNHNYDNHRSNSTQYSTNNSSPSSSSSSYASHFTNREPVTQHDELIRYIREAWTKVNEQGTQVYHCSEAEHQLKNFKPFNLEEYWGQRVVQNIQLSQGNQ